jgi:ribA/ribD-fused uncharacterized protein
MASQPRRVVLCTHGSFNPVHRGHVAMFRSAREALQTQGHSVVAGVIAITPARHILRKNTPPMHDELRLELIRLACHSEGMDWIQAIDGTAYKSCQQFIRGEEASLKRQLGRQDLVFAELLGSDVLLRYPPRQADSRMRVVICRAGDEERARQQAARSCSPATTVLLSQPSAALAVASSTRARAALAHADAAEVAALCGQAIAVRLQQLTVPEIYDGGADPLSMGPPVPPPSAPSCAAGATATTAAAAAADDKDGLGSSFAPRALDTQSATAGTMPPRAADDEDDEEEGGLAYTVPYPAVSAPTGAAGMATTEMVQVGLDMLKDLRDGEFDAAAPILTKCARPPRRFRHPLVCRIAHESASHSFARRLLSNILAHPTEPKYRTIKSSNAKIAALLATRGTRALLVGVGFVEAGDLLTLPEGSAVDAAEAAVAALAAQSREREASRDAFKAAEAAQRKERHGGEDADLVPMTTELLRQQWQAFGAGSVVKVLGFYSHSNGHYRSFSNFFEHEPIPFEIPLCAGREELRASGRPHLVQVRFTEKAIMLCKASAMGDYPMYDQILRADTPRQVKALGRGVGPWKQRVWDRIICSVARAVLVAKATHLPNFRALLLATGDELIAEATRNDVWWGIGIDLGRDEVQMPGRWKGTNVLGWALMEARAALREGLAAPSGSQTHLQPEQGPSSDRLQPARAGQGGGGAGGGHGRGKGGKVRGGNVSRLQ